MKIRFDEKDPQKIVSNIKKVMGERELAKMVDFECADEEIVVKISKLGTSTLVFSHAPAGAGSQLELQSEKIAFAHKAFKDEVKDKIMKVIQQAGGKIDA